MAFVQPRPDSRRQLIIAHGIRRRGSIFHPIDTGPFKLVVWRPTGSINVIRNPYSKPGRAYPTTSTTQFSAAHRTAFDPFPDIWPGV